MIQTQLAPVLLPFALMGGLVLAAPQDPGEVVSIEEVEKVEAPPAPDADGVEVADADPAPQPAPDVEPAPENEPAADTLQIRARTVYLGDGNRIDDGVVTLSDGRITRVGRGVEVDPDLPLIEHDGVLTAGMVAAHSWFGTRSENHDGTRALLPEARLAYTFHPGHSDFERALKAGVTSIVIAPTGQNLAGGKTCVVKTAGTLLKKESHLALSFSKDALDEGQVPFFFPFFSAEGQPLAVDDALESSGGNTSGARYPTSYAGSVKALGDAMAEAKGAFAAAKNGQLGVLIEAWERNEVARAAGFARQHGLKGAVRGAPLAGDLVSVLATSGLGVVLGPFDAGAATRTLKGTVALSEAGVPFAFSLGDSRSDPTQARMSAALAVGAGLNPVAAWKALSSDAARLAGVGDRVGRLERGLDADLVLWSGDPIDLTSRVEAVFIDGKLVHGGAQ